MSNFESQTSISLELFNSLERVDKVVWSNESFVCINEPTPTTSQPPTTTQTPTSTLVTSSTTQPPTSTTLGPPMAPIVTLSMVDKVIEIGTHKTLTITIEALVVGLFYRIQYRDFIINTFPAGIGSNDYSNDPSIVLNGASLPTEFTATSDTKIINIELYNPTGVKLFDRVLDTDDNLMRTIETCGKKKQTVSVSTGFFVGSDTIYMYFEKKMPTRFEVMAPSSRTVKAGVRPVTTITYNLEIEGFADVETIDDFFEIYTLMDQHRAGSNKQILKTDIADFILLVTPGALTGNKIIISFEKIYNEVTDLGVFSDYENPIAGKTKLIELLFTFDLTRIGGIAAFSLSNEKNNLIYKNLPIAISNSFSINYDYTDANDTSISKFDQPLINVGTRLFINPPASSMFEDCTEDEEYARLTNLGPSIEIEVDKVILPYPTIDSPPGENVATFTLRCSNLIIGRFYKLDYVMTANGCIHYAVPRHYNLTTGFGVFNSKIKLTTDHVFASHMGDYPEFGKPITEFDFDMMDDWFTIDNVQYQPPRGFVATDIVQSFVFKVKNKNGVIAFEKSKLKATVGGIGIRAFIQPGFDFYRPSERFRGTVNGSAIGMVELQDAPIPRLLGAGVMQMSFNCASPGGITTNVGLVETLDPLTDTHIAEDYVLLYKESRHDGTNYILPGLGMVRTLTDCDVRQSVILTKWIISNPGPCKSGIQYFASTFTLNRVRNLNLMSNIGEPHASTINTCCPDD